MSYNGAQITEAWRSPDIFIQLIWRYNPIGISNEVKQNRIFNRREMLHIFSSFERMHCTIQSEIAKFHHP